MKSRIRTKIMLLVLLMVALQPLNLLSAQVTEWKYETGAKIEASVVFSGDTLFVGSLDSNFYALDKTGQLIWKTKVPYQIKSTAAFYGNIICFEAGNKLYALNKRTGAEEWVHEPNDIIGKNVTQTFDPWDLKCPTPLLNDSVFYYGNEFGSVYGVNAETGVQEFTFNTGKNFAIRTKPAVVNDTLYFADFDGYVFAISLSDASLIWSVHTYSGSKPYADFGPVIGDMVISGTNLFFGIRNHNFQVLNRITGELSWNFNSGGTWISGIPVIKNDTLYIGTSDSQFLMAFDALSGNRLWNKSIGLGIYNATVFYKNHLIIAAGDEQMSSKTGKGSIKILDKNGELINGLAIKGSVFNTPIINGNKLYFGSYSNHIECVNLEKMLTELSDSISSNIEALNIGTITKKTVKLYELGYIKNTGNDTIAPKTSVASNGFPEAAIISFVEGPILIGDSALLKIRIISSELENGEYTENVLVTFPDNESLNFEVPISFSIDINTSSYSSTSASVPVKVYPNPVTDMAAFLITVSTAGNGSIQLFDLTGKQTSTIQIDVPSAGSYSYQWNANKGDIALYKVVFNDELIDSGKLLLK